MSIDITVYPRLSPRVIEINSPQTSATVQEIIDAVRDWEDSIEGDLYPYLIDAAGKEDLGGGVYVGITATLQNAQIRFAARNTVVSTGTVTTGDTNGVTLTDGGADFTADGVEVGYTVFNATTGAMETIISVGTTSLQSMALIGGSRQDWQIGDSYQIYVHELCNISGGNLVAVDDNGDPLEPIFYAPNVNLVKTSSSSGTISQLEISQLQYMVESLRVSHQARGQKLFWDPENGDDGNDGLSPERAVATYAQAESLAIADNDDVIFLMATATGAQTVCTEAIEIAKNGIRLRGPGRDIVFRPASEVSPVSGTLYSEAATIWITADRVELSGMVVETYNTPITYAQQGIVSTGSYNKIHNIDLNSPHTSGVVIGEGAQYNTLENIIVSDAGSYGIAIGDEAKYTTVRNVHTHGCGTAGIVFFNNSGLGYSPSEYTYLYGPITCHTNQRGIWIYSTDYVYIDPNINVKDNSIGDIIVYTVLTNEDHVFYLNDVFKDRIWDSTIEGNEVLNKILWKAK